MAGGYGGYGNGVGAVSSQQYFNQALSNQRQVSDLKLDYERQLWAEKLKAAQMQAAIQYGGQQGWGGSPWGVASPYAMNGAMLGAGALPVAAVPTAVPYAGIPQGYGAGFGQGFGQLPFTSGSGQTNINNQVAVGAATQTVTNNNDYSNTVRTAPPAWGSPYGGSPYGQPWGMPYGQQQSGGFLSRLFGGW